MYIYININKLLCKARGYHPFQDLVTNTHALPVPGLKYLDSWNNAVGLKTAAA